MHPFMSPSSLPRLDVIVVIKIWLRSVIEKGGKVSNKIPMKGVSVRVRRCHHLS